MSASLQVPEDSFLREFCSLHHYDYSVGSKTIIIPVLILTRQTGQCPFLSVNSCSIHEFKPYYCSAAPFISILLQNREWVEVCSGSCPGFGKGKCYSEQDIACYLAREMELQIEDLEVYNSGFYTYVTSILAGGVRDVPRQRTGTPGRAITVESPDRDLV
jgi:Fe-S-cluster containining protein